jgi:H+/Cl- antiporter ClcA
VTNEQYLHVSYFAAAIGGAALATLTAALLASANRQATQGRILPRLGKFLRRVLPPWLILTLLLGFMSVSYMECRSYSEVVADRSYLVDKTQQQIHRMAIYLAIAVMAYAAVLVLFLWARARALWYGDRMQKQHPLDSQNLGG